MFSIPFTTHYTQFTLSPLTERIIMTPPLRTTGIAAARDYQELPAWVRAMHLAEQVYAATEAFPEREIAGLASALRSNAVAVASHIATASARTEYGIAESYSKSQSALAELATQIELAARLGYVADKLTAEIDEVGRLLIGLKHSLKTEAKTTARQEREVEKRDREFEQRKPRGEFKPRDREFKPRDRSDRETGREERQYKPRGEFRSRDGDDRKPYGDKKPYEKKSYGDRKPYGDKKPYEKKSYGDRKPYGDKKPFGDRKPRGDRPYRRPRDE